MLPIKFRFAFIFVFIYLYLFIYLFFKEIISSHNLEWQQRQGTKPLDQLSH